MKVVLNFKDDTFVETDLGEGQDLEKYDHVVTNFRNAIEKKGNIEFTNGVRKFDELKSIEIVF